MLVRFFVPSGMVVWDAHLFKAEPTEINLKTDDCSLGKCEHHTRINQEDNHKVLYYFSPYVLPDFIQFQQILPNVIYEKILGISPSFVFTTILYSEYRGPPTFSI